MQVYARLSVSNEVSKMFLKTSFCSVGRALWNKSTVLRPQLPLLNQTVRSVATRKRFYRKTGILHSGSNFEITLDQRKLKTPRGNLFLVDSEPLALAVAAEWDAQKENIVQTSMHLSTLCNTVIDNPNNLNKFDIVQYMLNYIDTDCILFQSGDEDDLYKLQVAEWDPIIQWFCDRFRVDLHKTRNIGGPSVKEETKAVLSKYLMSYNFAALNGFVYGVDTLKSVILTCACVEKVISVEKAVLLSRLEEEFQLGYWGRVEWAHDLSQHDLQARLASTALFIHFNSTSNSIQIKNEMTA
ncbi:PREDICTED: ATP synthase mitochondrial F1 complex assembly factor 2 [Nicrophorus vespilloides]|uniref:ATP synthase mitochondrial F1 complex assembly factor 2 n=1 Tax=Nicrophorus vespilloides TaxID=110193 RepID=A0ABM1MXS6_NICVS|nr:PREDICTED: ATP synthase mitochondrial F1 complex assembly factor 2 [Nicrophorus vespilloides]